MRYFSGFCFHNEAALFANKMVSNDYTVAGFSYGAINAFEYALHASSRIDRLILLSPAFFQTVSPRYIQLQLDAFSQKPQDYIETFLANVAYPTKADLTPYQTIGRQEELHTLLTYQWSEEKLGQLCEKGAQIEVHLGKKDKIIQSQKAYDFFKPYATIYFYQEAGHLL